MGERKSWPNPPLEVPPMPSLLACPPTHPQEAGGENRVGRTVHGSRQPITPQGGAQREKSRDTAAWTEGLGTTEARSVLTVCLGPFQGLGESRFLYSSAHISLCGLLSSTKCFLILVGCVTIKKGFILIATVPK